MTFLTCAVKSRADNFLIIHVNDGEQGTNNWQTAVETCATKWWAKMAVGEEKEVEG